MSVAPDIEEIVAKSGASREPESSPVKFLISTLCIIWAVFQMWVASPMQFDLAVLISSKALLFNEMQVKYIHLSFATALIFLTFPAFSNSPKNRIPAQDWIIGIIMCCSVMYLYVLYESVMSRMGRPSDVDILVSVFGIAFLFEAARRSVGLAMASIGIIFIMFCHFGESMPDIISHKNASFAAIASHQWLSSEGVFGVALGVSSSFVFLYVLFGSFLEKTGAGNFFIHLSFSLLSRFTGGPAKAAVVASGLMGMVSGSSIANTVTVGTFTVPLMRKMGLNAEKAGAIEVSAGINGQIMPPVMGAAAFIIAEYLSIPYTEVVRHSFLPAILVYIGLLYIVHIEALKLGIGKKTQNTGQQIGFIAKIASGLLSTCLFVIFCGLCYFMIEGFAFFPGIGSLIKSTNFFVVFGFLSIIYVLVLWYQSKFADLQDVRDSSDDQFVSTFEVLRTGLHFIIPIVVLVWCLLVEGMSPQLSGYWTVMFLIFTTLTQRPIKAFFRSESNLLDSFKAGFDEFLEAMISGSKNMTVVAVATGTAGIIVGSVSLTGLGVGISSIIDEIANGSLIVSLLITAIMCIILGMGMPTTACYIIVSTLMVPVLKFIMYKNALFIPLLSLHLFVFYFGLMADVTPPVGLASYAAAAISGGNPIKTGAQAFLYNMRTMIIPFVFVFNPSILLFGVETNLDFITIITSSFLGILTIAAGTQGYFILKSKLYESLILVIGGLCFLFPNVFMDIAYKPTKNIPIESISTLNLESGKDVVLNVEGYDSIGKFDSRVVRYVNQADQPFENSLINFGITSKYHEHQLVVSDIDYTKPAYKKWNINNNYMIKSIDISRTQPSQFIVLIVAFSMVLLVFLIQKRRTKLDV